MASDLLGAKHNPTEVKEVVMKLRLNDLAFYDEKRSVRRVPVFEYGADGEPARITHWQERPVAKSLEEALLNGMDFYKQGRGWIRGGKKAERDYGYTPEPVEE